MGQIPSIFIEVYVAFAVILIESQFMLFSGRTKAALEVGIAHVIKKFLWTVCHTVDLHCGKWHGKCVVTENNLVTIRIL